MRRFICGIIIVFLVLETAAQVGIGTINPDEKSALDLTSNSKGLLIPRLTTIQREALSSGGFSEGMLVYDKTLNILFVGYGNGANSTKWYALNAWKTEYKTQNGTPANMTTMTATGINHGKIGIGAVPSTDKLEVAGNVKATEFIGNGVAPLGSIVMWSGTVAPSGWVICNGQTHNGFTTPNLSSKFIVSNHLNSGTLSTKGSTTASTGGADEVTLTIAQMPGHSHTASSSPAGAHSHNVPGYTKRTNNTTDNDNTRSCPDIGWWRTNKSTSPVANHTHSISVGNSGGNQPHENRPPYYVLAYIMRVN